MFIPQAKAKSPVSAGVNSISTGSFNGSARVMFKAGNTTSVPHVLSVVRTNVIRAGVPARSVNFAGSYPCSLTITFAVWADSPLRPSLDGGGALWVGRGPESKTLPLGPDEEAALGHDDIAWLNA